MDLLLLAVLAFMALASIGLPMLLGLPITLTGFISLADLSYILSSITENLADDELAEIVALAESPYEAGRVSFDRFLTLMMLHKRGAPSPKPYKRGDVVDEHARS